MGNSGKISFCGMFASIHDRLQIITIITQVFVYSLNIKECCFIYKGYLDLFLLRLLSLKPQDRKIQKPHAWSCLWFPLQEKTINVKSTGVMFSWNFICFRSLQVIEVFLWPLKEAHAKATFGNHFINGTWHQIAITFK